MAKDTIMLSPELMGVRREALATEAIQAGNLLEVSGGNVALQSLAASTAPVSMIFAVENVSVAGDHDYTYANAENVHYRTAQKGALVNVRAVAATYNAGDYLETALSGELQAQTTGLAVAQVPHFGGEVVTTGLLMVHIV